MLATAERTRPDGALGPVKTIWHVPVDPQSCDGDCDAHRILCDDGPGIGIPGGIRDVPRDLTGRSDERWCPPCLAVIENGASRHLPLRRKGLTR
ncbi:hypothetical protein AB0E08_29885 [Streptomyces sp. NPDC048281]|uniref:hypothetical protein n=1 Tax=Streptomyces sp. NPDC048281 TaxID=3154715 RepID=UPI0034184CC6